MTFAASQATCAWCDGATITVELDMANGCKAMPLCVDHALRSWCGEHGFAYGPHHEGRECRACGIEMTGRRHILLPPPNARAAE